MSAATERLPLRARLGGRWFGYWAVWGISMPFGLLVLASDLVASTDFTVISEDASAAGDITDVATGKT